MLLVVKDMYIVAGLSSKAPNTVNISLANLIYDGLTFHRIIDGFMIQGGIQKETEQEVQAILWCSFPVMVIQK